MSNPARPLPQDRIDSFWDLAPCIGDDNKIPIITRSPVPAAFLCRVQSRLNGNGFVMRSSFHEDPEQSDRINMGRVLYLQANIFNHACRADAGSTWEDDSTTITIRLCRDVKAGDEVCISYCAWSITDQLATRRAVLHEKYSFTCECRICWEEEHMPAQDPAYQSDFVIYQKVQKMQVDGWRMLDDGRYSEAIPILEPSIPLARLVLGPVHESFFSLVAWVAYCAYRDRELYHLRSAEYVVAAFLEAYRIAKGLGWGKALNPKHPYYILWKDVNTFSQALDEM
jgi:hypothetical protein